MTEQFKNALTSFSFEAAAGGAIRHLCDLGYDAEAIAGHLDYPVPIERIKKEMEAYEAEKQAIASGEKEEYQIIKETGKYGKVTFRKVKKNET